MFKCHELQPAAALTDRPAALERTVILQENGPFRCLEYMCKCENASSEALVLLDHKGHNKQPLASGCLINRKTKPLHIVVHVRMSGTEVIGRLEQIIK